MKKVLLVLAVFASINSFSQNKIYIYDGNSENIKHISNYDIVFNYDEMIVPNIDKDKGNKKEKQYQNIWFDSRGEIYEPAFVKVLRKYTKKSGIQIERNNNFRYLIKINIQNIETGWNAIMMVKHGRVDFELEIIDKLNPDKILFKVKQHTIGNGNKSTAQKRIEDAYIRFGKIFGKYIKNTYIQNSDFISILTNEEIVLVSKYEEKIMYSENKKQAIEKLNESKKLLDLELITQEEYDKIKEELAPLIIKQ